MPAGRCGKTLSTSPTSNASSSPRSPRRTNRCTGPTCSKSNYGRFATGGQDGVLLLDAWLRWAARSRLTPFTELARKIRAYFRSDIINSLTHRLSNGLIEATNTKIRLLTRIAFGFKSVDALIALTKLP